MADEASTIALLDRLLLKVALTKDETLPVALASFLIPAIEKLVSPDASVKAKVIELLSHVTKRAKDQKFITFPVVALLNKYCAAETPLVVRNILMTFIDMGLPRVPPAECADLVPLMLKALPDAPHKSQLLRLLLPLLQHLRFPDDSAGRKSVLLGESDASVPSSSSSTDAEAAETIDNRVEPIARVLLPFLMDVLVNAGASAPAADAIDAVPPPGMSLAACHDLAALNLSADEWVQCRIGVVRVCGSGVFSEDQVATHVMVALADPHHTVVSEAERASRTVFSLHATLSLDCVRRLYALVLGTPKEDRVTPPPQRRRPVAARVRERLIARILSSPHAIAVFPAVIQTCFECWFGEGKDHLRLRMAGTDLALKLCQVKTLAPAITKVLLQGLINLLDAEAARSSSQVSQGAYMAIGWLARTHPPLAHGSLDLVDRFFTALARIPNDNDGDNDDDNNNNNTSNSKGDPSDTNTQSSSTGAPPLGKPDRALQSAIRRAVALLAQAYRHSDTPAHVSSQLSAFLMERVTRGGSATRTAAVLCANVAFPFANVAARFMCIQAAGDRCDAVRDEGTRGLQGPVDDPSRGFDASVSSDGHTAAATVAALWPDVADLSTYVRARADANVAAGFVFRRGQASLPFPPAMLHAALTFTMRSLRNAAGCSESDSLVGTDASETTNNAGAESSNNSNSSAADHEEAIDMEDAEAPVPDAVIAFLHQPRIATAVKDMCALAEFALGDAAQVSLRHLGARVLLLVVRGCSDTLAPEYAQRFAWIERQLKQGHRETRAFLAALCSLVTPHLDREMLAAFAESLLTTMVAKGVGAQIRATSLLACGHTLAATSQYLAETVVHNAVRAVSAAVHDRDSTVSAAACEAIGVMGSAGPLPLQPGDFETSKAHVVASRAKADADSIVQHAPTKADIVCTLLERLRVGTAAVVTAAAHANSSSASASSSSAPSKTAGASAAAAAAASSATSGASSSAKQQAAERAAMALGRLHQGEPSFPFRDAVLKGLLDTHNAKNVEMHFSIGQALSLLGDAADVISTIVDRFVMRGSVNGRRAGCVWLLSLVRFVPVEQLSVESMQQCQAAFTTMLGDPDDFMQEVSGKGLSIVHSRGDGSAKKLLVDGLVDTLMTGKRNKAVTTGGHLTGDTRVFAEGTLGKSPDGSGLSTYQELCGLATDMGQPDLIYKFLNLASHHAAWRTRRGAAFSFAEIAADSSELLEQHLPRLIPRLFRLQYDPSDRVRDSMTGIWRALVADPYKAVDTHREAVMQELVVSLGSDQWRVRESACLATADFISGRPFDDLGERAEELWRAANRTLDDVKESVRKAAASCTRKLSLFAVRVCNPSMVSNPAAASRAIKVLLPFLLGLYGLGSSVSDVRDVCLSTTLDIVKNAGAHIRPHVALVVQAMLEGMSNLEPQVLNYLSLHYGGGAAAAAAASGGGVKVAGDSVESVSGTGSSQVGARIEELRATAARHSPLLEAAEMCVQHADEAGVHALVDTLRELVRHGVGLQTRCGTARIVASLAQTHTFLLGHSAGAKLLKVAQRRLSDRSSAVRAAYAYAVAHVVRACTDEPVDKLVHQLVEMCVETDTTAVNGDAGNSGTVGETAQSLDPWLIAGRVCTEIGRHAGDVFRRHGNELIPLSFVGATRCGAEPLYNEQLGREQDAVLVWRGVWEEHTAGTAGGLRLFAGETLALALRLLKSASWGQRQRGAMAMKRMVEAMGKGDGLDAISSSMVEALLTGLEGRTWDGKSALLDALVAILTHSSATLSAALLRLDDVLGAVLREAKKRDKVYRREALKCLAAVVKRGHFGENAIHFESVRELVWPLLAELADDDTATAAAAAAEDDDEVRKSRPLALATQATAWSVLAALWPESARGEWIEKVCELMATTAARSVWNVRQAVLETALVVANSMPSEANEVAVALLIRVVSAGVADTKYVQSRQLAMSLGRVLVKHVDGRQSSQGALLTEAIAPLTTDVDVAVREDAKRLWC